MLVKLSLRPRFFKRTCHHCLRCLLALQSKQQNRNVASWHVRAYEWYVAGQWVSTMPPECLDQGVPARGRAWSGGSARSEVQCEALYCIYKNLWWVHVHVHWKWVLDAVCKDVCS